MTQQFPMVELLNDAREVGGGPRTNGRRANSNYSAGPGSLNQQPARIESESRVGSFGLDGGTKNGQRPKCGNVLRRPNAPQRID